MLKRLADLLSDALEVVSFVTLKLGRKQNDGLDWKVLWKRLPAGAFSLLSFAVVPATRAALAGRRVLLGHSLVITRVRLHIGRAEQLRHRLERHRELVPVHAL